ncbi:hypothetical protein SteCoe_29840 [Stentor coeruleus]|uniref:LNR domain-containing protein n=1 Tax=Stentor coeruleus TaxID=5963 RepID=A0A1R2B5E2_9CILI|nr:hypothetical protein SteCoe_29840 [Stentor coeruleus]
MIIFMTLLGILFLASKGSSRSVFTCDESLCLNSWVGDGMCDKLCMNPSCNYDSQDSSSTEKDTPLYGSDCYSSCLYSNCLFEKLGDGSCDEDCNRYECGWDFGDCGYCADGCTLDKLTNSVCDPSCNNEACRYDNNDCGWCAKNCFLQDLSDGLCQESCNIEACLWDNYSCVTSLCAPKCPDILLNNGECNYFDCLTAACKYDGNDCTCSPGCTYNQLFTETECIKDSNGVIIDPCATSDCDFKWNLCGNCNKGCFDNMIGDDNCNIECNVENCNYDLGDCGCAPGCETMYSLTSGFKYAGGCKLECMAFMCGYNSGDCSEKNLIIASILNQLISENISAVFNPDICNGNCTYSMILEYENDDKMCSVGSVCDTDQCLHCFGKVENKFPNCMYSDGKNCLISEGWMINEISVNNIVDCPFGFTKSDSISQIFENKLSWCFIEPVFYTKNKYRLFYVNPDFIRNSSEDFGNGDITNPMISLFYALESVYAAYTKIILQSKELYYEFNRDQKSPLRTEDNNPLSSFMPSLKLYELWIIGDETLNERPIVYWKGNLVIKPKSETFYIKYIEFRGTKILHNCTFDYCLYCPYVVFGENKAFDDRNRVIDMNLYNNDYGKNCDKYNSDVMFYFTVPAYIENVAFSGFRHQFSQFIYSESTLSMTNVSFSKMQAYEGMSVILGKSSNFYLSYTLGSVSDLSAGYEITEFIALGSFLICEDCNSISISDVNFTYNLAYSNLLTGVISSLIYSKNHIGIITITGCIFEKNFVNGLIFIDVSSLSYSDYQIENGVSQALSQQHFTLSNTKIINNYCSNYLIYYNMQKLRHNIQISNLLIQNATVGINGFINIQNTGVLSNTDTVGQKIKTLVSGKEVSVYIPSRSLLIDSIKIVDSYCGGQALTASIYPLAYIKNVLISNVGDGSKDTIMKIINLFYSSGRYLSSMLPSTEILSITCSKIMNFQDNYYLYIDELVVNNAKCTAQGGTGGIYAESITKNVTIYNTTLQNTEHSSSEPLSLYIGNTANAFLANILLENLTNTDGSLMSIYKATNVYIENFKAKSLESAYLGTVILNQIENVNISGLYIDKAYTKFSNGGCLSVVASSKGINLSIRDIEMNYCYAATGVGGGFFIDSVSNDVINVIMIENAVVTNSQAKDGAILYISNKVVLGYDKESVITNLTGYNNNGTQGGIIADYRESGLLCLDKFVLYYNKALHAFINAFYPNNLMMLKIDNSYIHSSESSDSVVIILSLKPGCTITFNNVTFYNISATALKVSKITINAYNITFSYLFSVYYGDSYSNLSLKLGNFHHINSVVLTFTLSSYFNCTSCRFGYNYYTLIEVSEESYIELFDSDISNNTASSKVVVYISGKQDSKSNLIENCLIQNNTATTDGQIYLLNTNMTISSSIIKENKCLNSDYNGIYTTNSQLTIISSSFINQEAIGIGSYIYSVETSLISISKSCFESGLSHGKAGNIYISFSLLEIIESNFTDNLASNEGGCIYSIDSKVVVNNSIFAGSSASLGSVIYMSGGILFMISSSISNSSTSGSYVTASVYLVADVLLIIDMIKVFDGEIGGILAYDIHSCTLSDSTFSNLKIMDYGAVTFIGASIFGSVAISSSTFTYNNSTGNGGALFISSVSLAITDSEFSFNTASKNGGGIYLSSLDCSSCTFSISGSSSFFSNSCPYEGGAIKWADYKPSISDSVVFYNNSAEYGSNIAGLPAMLQFSISRNLAVESKLETLTNIIPGQHYNSTIYLYMLDSIGSIVTSDNQSTLNIESNDSKSGRDSNNSYSVHGTTTFICSQGIFSLTDFSPNGPPGTTMTMNVSTNGIKSGKVPNDDVEYNNAASINLELRECIQGEEIGPDMCKECDSGTFLIYPADSCLSCPTGAVCPGGDSVIPNVGYWRSSVLSEYVYKCSISGACLGGSTSDFIGACFEGYEGVLCNSCQIGFSLSNSGKCSKCPEQGTNIIILLSLGALMIAVCYILVKTTLNSAFKPKSLHSIYIKIFTNYLQLVYLTTQFELEWPSYVLELFYIQKSAATISEQVFSIDCYFVGSSSSNSSSIYFNKLAMYCIIPIIIALISLIVWTLIGMAKGTFSYLNREFYTTAIVLFFLVYPNIVKSMFMNFQCTQFDIIGWYLDQNTAIQCWDTIHTKYSLIIAVPGMITWAVGVPTFLLVIMSKKKRYLYRDNNRVIFGFLFNGYKSSNFYWEFLIMYRKIIIITIAVFMSSSTMLQALTVIILLIISLYLQYSCRPYSQSELNHMETQALFIATVTIYCGLYYLSRSIGDIVKVILFAIIAVGNGYFILYWIYYMMQAFMEVFLKYFPQFKVTFKKGDSYTDGFFEEKMTRKGVFFNEFEGAKCFTFFDNKTKNVKECDLPENMPDLFIEVFKKEVELFDDLELIEF